MNQSTIIESIKGLPCVTDVVVNMQGHILAFGDAQPGSMGDYGWGLPGNNVRIVHHPLLGWTFCGMIPKDQVWVDWQPVTSITDLKALTRNALEAS